MVDLCRDVVFRGQTIITNSGQRKMVDSGGGLLPAMEGHILQLTAGRAAARLADHPIRALDSDTPPAAIFEDTLCSHDWPLDAPRRVLQIIQSEP